jgi:hypothetical protein
MLKFNKDHFYHYYDTNAQFLALGNNYIPFFYAKDILSKGDQGIVILLRHRRFKNYHLQAWHQAQGGG